MMMSVYHGLTALLAVFNPQAAAVSLPELTISKLHFSCRPRCEITSINAIAYPGAAVKYCAACELEVLKTSEYWDAHANTYNGTGTGAYCALWKPQQGSTCNVAIQTEQDENISVGNRDVYAWAMRALREYASGNVTVMGANGSCRGTPFYAILYD
ncbi:hypothetical protein HD806DRAFT_534910 [Xylariaceae sp. AK1471]|nr:hypothetical protein HD806DRAFT_534910 [Xylariaceae sp. AK1471]